MENEPSFFECLCLFNPLWCDDDDDDVNDDKESHETFLVMDDMEVPLSARAEDDQYTLPKEFDAIEDYYKSFDNLDNMNPRNRSMSFTVNKDIHSVIYERLSAGGNKGYASLNSDLMLFKTGMLKYMGDQKLEYMKAYECFMDKYDSCRIQDEENAQIFTENAKNPANKKEMRQTYYKKAIYYTHPMSVKLQLKKEYIEYCETLKK